MNEAEKNYFEFPLQAGKGKFISTYSGPNLEIPPAFRGEPINFKIPGETPQQIAQAFYDALEREKEIRVSVAAAHIKENNYECAIINYYDS